MEELRPDVPEQPEQPPAEAPAPPARFAAAGREIIAAFGMYAAAYVYTCYLLPDDPWRRLWLTVFTLAFVTLTELLHRQTPRARESWIWLGCMAVNVLAAIGNRCLVWGGWTEVFAHIFAVWWALSRAGRLAEGESGHLLPYDALNGFVVFPFQHFFLRARTVWYALTHLRAPEKKARPETVLFTLLAVVLAVLLLILAASLLMAADSGFASLLDGVARWLRFDLDDEIVLRLLLSLPVGAYLFGLLAGSGREDAERLRQRGAGLCRWLGTLRKVPGGVWAALTGLFCLLYLVFFVVQARYLFGAFTRTLPEGFNISEYARQGFFELCKVMAVNFVLLWLVTRSGREATRWTKPLCLALLAESLLFAVIAFSKLAFYLSYGITPLRMQSTWLVCVLACGCVCAAVSLLTGRKTFRIWMVFGAVTVSLLSLL